MVPGKTVMNGGLMSTFATVRRGDNDEAVYAWCSPSAEDNSFDVILMVGSKLGLALGVPAGMMYI